MFVLGRCFWIEQKKKSMGWHQPMKGQIHSAGDLTPFLSLTLKQHFPLRAIYFVANSFLIVFIIRPRVVFHTFLVTIWKCTSFGNVYRISKFEFCISDVIYFDERTKRKFVKVLKTVNWFVLTNVKRKLSRWISKLEIKVSTNLLLLENFPWPWFEFFICLLPSL